MIYSRIWSVSLNINGWKVFACLYMDLYCLIFIVVTDWETYFAGHYHSSESASPAATAAGDTWRVARTAAYSNLRRNLWLGWVNSVLDRLSHPSVRLRAIKFMECSESLLRVFVLPHCPTWAEQINLSVSKQVWLSSHGLLHPTDKWLMETV